MELLRRWRSDRRRAPARGPAEVVLGSAPACEAARLYVDLEAALAARGIVRDPGLTPLRHAERLAREGHPLAEEVLALTHAYLEARFGGGTPSEAERADYARRVQRIRDGAPVSSLASEASEARAAGKGSGGRLASGASEGGRRLPQA
jgi:hypothetical protein